MLWSGALRRLVQHLTRGAVDPFVWTDCKFGYFLIYFGFNYSSALLIIISVEKFIALYFPLRTKTICTVHVAKRVSLATAIIFLIFDSQFLIIGKVYTNQYGDYCDYGNVPRAYLRLLFSTIIAILYSFGPFGIMILVDFAIIYKFMMAKLKTRLGGSGSTNQALSKSATKGTAMLLTISFAFILLTGPIAIAHIIWEVIPDLTEKITITFEYVNHGINGILYCVSGSRFRNELLRTFGRCGSRITRGSGTTRSSAAITEVSAATIEGHSR